MLPISPLIRYSVFRKTSAAGFLYVLNYIGLISKVNPFLKGKVYEKFYNIFEI